MTGYSHADAATTMPIAISVFQTIALRITDSSCGETSNMPRAKTPFFSVQLWQGG
jgi:hypothetical protein